MLRRVFRGLRGSTGRVTRGMRRFVGRLPGRIWNVLRLGIGGITGTIVGIAVLVFLYNAFT